MSDILNRLQIAIQMESAVHAPRTTQAIEAMRAAKDEIWLLRSGLNIAAGHLEDSGALPQARKARATAEGKHE